MRDTFKKLIYAIEQSYMAKQAQTTDGQRPNSFAGAKRVGGRQAQFPGTSIADQNFGVTAQSILPNLENNTSMQNARMSEPFSASGSFLDAKSQSLAGG